MFKLDIILLLILLFFIFIGWENNKSSFTPVSRSYENKSSIFQPEGYGLLGNYDDMKSIGYLKRHVKGEI